MNIYLNLIFEYNQIPLNLSTKMYPIIYKDLGKQIDRIILSREYLTYDWVMPMHPYMVDYDLFYTAVTLMNVIDVNIQQSLPSNTFYYVIWTFVLSDLIYTIINKP